METTERQNVEERNDVKQRIKPPANVSTPYVAYQPMNPIQQGGANQGFYPVSTDTFK